MSTMDLMHHLEKTFCVGKSCWQCEIRTMDGLPCALHTIVDEALRFEQDKLEAELEEVEQRLK